MFKKNIILLVVFFSVKYIFSCPNLTYYYDLLEKAKENFHNSNYNQSLYFFQQIESCERFYNTESNVFLYALTISKVCIENENNTQNFECSKLLKQMIRLLQISLKLLLPESNFLNERSERYFLLGVAYFKLGNCIESKKSFYQSSLLKPTEKNQNNYKNLLKFCP